MDVTITLTIDEIDAARWAEIHRVSGEEAVQESIRKYVRNIVSQDGVWDDVENDGVYLA